MLILCCRQLHQPNTGHDKKLQSELSRKRQEVEKLRMEKDATNMLLEYTQSKIKVTLSSGEILLCQNKRKHVKKLEASPIHNNLGRCLK